MDALEHLALGRAVEVDHHVAAEDEVEGFAQLTTSWRLIRLKMRKSIRRASSGLTRMKPALAPVPRRKWRLQPLRAQAARVGGSRRRGCAVSSTRVSMSLRRSWPAPTRPASRPPSWPANRAPRRWLAALHQMRSGRAPRARRSSTRAWKWCSSRKNEVRLVVRQLTNSCHSPSGCAAHGALQPLQVGREAAVAGLAQAARQAAVDHGLLAGVQADARALVDQLRTRSKSAGVSENSGSVARSGGARADGFMAALCAAGGASTCDGICPVCPARWRREGQK
jgi:hypothetical protein